MRRIDIIAITGLLVLSLAGCASGKKNSEDVQTETTMKVEDIATNEA